MNSELLRVPCASGCECLKCLNFQILEINCGLYLCGLHHLKIALEGTNAFKHWLDAEDQFDYFYPGYKNTRHVFLSPFEGICGLKGRL